jgi:hypothetical protein
MRNAIIAFASLIFASQIIFAQGFSKKCIDEFMAIPETKENFDLQNFTKDLAIEIVKVKAQLKLPFGKPADNKVTDIGITVGCLKAFPETPGQILAILKEVGLGTAVGIANSIGASSKPALKECDAIFNPSKKFCYDGGIYDLCDGMSYNPTTHICSGDIANRALCNGTRYNPLKQICENNTILTVCGETLYDSKTHVCKDNVVFAFPKCGEILYDPQTQVCKDNALLARCGETFYDPKTHICKKDVVLLRRSYRL